MICNRKKCVPDVFRQFLSRCVQSGVQMTKFRCVVARSATFFHADVHIRQLFIGNKMLGTQVSSIFHGFHQNTGKPGISVISQISRILCIFRNCC